MHNRHLYPDDPNYPARKRLWINDPIDGSAILRESSRQMFDNWCEEHCSGRFWVGMGFIDFELQEDWALATLSHYNPR